MPEPRVEIDYRQFINAFRDWVDSTDDPEPLIRQALNEVAGAARPPVDSGRLDGSEQIRVSKSEKSGEVRWTVPYARFAHDGTKHMAAQPWAREALDHTEPRIIERIRDGVSDLIARKGLN